MKKSVLNTLFTFLLIALTTTFAHAQEKKGARLEYKKQVEDLGTIYTDALEVTTLDIEFTNDGDEPLMITNARGCCGTRIKDYPKEPIMPGEEAKIQIEFRLAPRAHNINRSVSVMSNDERGMRVFRIRGEVAEPEQ